MSDNQIFGHIWWQISLPYILVGMVWAHLLHLTSGEAPTDVLFPMIALAGGVSVGYQLQGGAANDNQLCFHGCWFGFILLAARSDSVGHAPGYRHLSTNTKENKMEQLYKAAKAMERFYERDDECPIERFERVADWFWLETGVLRNCKGANAAYTYSTSHLGFKFMSRCVPGGYRVWRVAIED